VLDNGSIAEVGNYKELSENPDSLFSSFLSVVLDTGAHSHASENEDEEEEESSTDSDKESFDDKSLGSNVWEGFLSKFSPKKPIEPMPDKSKKNHVIDGESYQNIVSKVPTSPKKRRISKKASFKEKKSDKLSSSVKSVDKAPPPTTPLMTSELGEREKGQVTSEVYLTWAKAAGGTLVGIVVILAYIVDQGIGVASKWWLTYWSRNGGGSPSAAREFLLVYAIINLTSIVSMFGRVVFLMFSGLRASRKLFTELLEVVLQAPMSFFDTTPAGRIINRFSKDIFTIDEKLVATMRSYFATLFNVFGVIIVISYVSPYFIICLVPLLAFYLQQQKFFTKTYRELKRLDSVNRSPLYALLGETLDGVSTIRAYNAEPTLVSRIISMLDEQQNAYFLTCTAQCWLAVRLELVGSLIICSACLLAVYQHLSIGGNETFAGLAGLSISFALSVTQSLNWTVRMSSDLEAHMVSVERVRQYCQLPTEARHHLPSDKSLLYSWPSDGKIVFSSAKLRYRPGLPLVLKGLDIEIPPMSKIGVVGRTGAGKSTLMVSLFRIVELSSGTISIDGIDISKVGLNLLRSKIAVIPQDPVLFSGSIRSNLDPFHEYGDERLFEVLERVGLTTNGTIQKSQSSNSLRSDVSLSASTPNAVKSLSDEVLEGGFNYSVGQRQLLVIARSLLRGAKIVIMDEATASVDADTDARIQRVMRTEFKDSTCITVAHRINTILDSDYILVMDDGQAAEFDKPDVLLKKGGLFKDLVDAWEQEHS
jgi:ATP-binding cassette subfamily C (CFTR/MRP) protein 1